MLCQRNADSMRIALVGLECFRGELLGRNGCAGWVGSAFVVRGTALASPCKAEGDTIVCTMETSNVWRSRPVFITSTFCDMHAERDWLRIHVFPVLEERLRDRFHHLETVDLRWGVDSTSAAEEQARKHLVLTVCFDEIRRSRPFLIGLLGDRYGWTPPSARLAAAAAEAGLTGDIAGKSVTELEIIHGVLGSADQQRRSWFYLRSPLPYDTMSRELAACFSDAFSTVPGATDNVRHLHALKERLRRELPTRVRSYHARWNADTGCVDGLESWGTQVLDDMWSDLEAETAAFVRERPRSWQAQDRWVLDEFVEGRVRGFVGRSGVTSDLIRFATDASSSGAPWALCLTADAGSGKSSLFGHVYRALREKDVFVLAHAAGISVRSTQVDLMLRRWIGELALVLGQADPLDDQSSPEEIDAAFSDLLRQVAAVRRVAVLIDALDQFEPTTRASHLTWMTSVWPPNARFVATGIPGTQSGALLRRPGVVMKQLQAIDRAEAVAIVTRICEHYHRTLPLEVVDLLLAKRHDDASPAYGNPLWLELATERLNLIGGEVLAQADASTGVTGIVVVLLSQVDAMPSEIAELYGWLLSAAEREVGTEWTRAFLGAIAVSRSGWRESDLKALVPAMSHEPWDDLRLASLRRTLRAHMVHRGVNAQWDLSHEQMRRAVAHRMAERGQAASTVHDSIADHLLSLRREDPLHETETLFHLMAGTSLSRAAEYYGGHRTPEETDGATGVLAQLVAGGRAADVASLLDQPVSPNCAGNNALRFIVELNSALESLATLDTRLRLLLAAERCLRRLAAGDPLNQEWHHGVAVSQVQIGNARLAEGDLSAALTAFASCLAITERLAAADPASNEWQHGIAASRLQIGDTRNAQGNIREALMEYDAALAILVRLSATEPNNSQIERDLAVAHQKLGAGRIAAGNLPEAAASFARGLAIGERLIATNRNDVGYERDVASSHLNVGDAFRAQGRLADALAAYLAAFTIDARLASADPGNAMWQRELSVSHDRIGDAQMALGDLSEAQAAYHEAFMIRERLTAADPGNTVWSRSIAISHQKLGEVWSARGNLPEAVAEFSASLAIAEGLAAKAPDDVDLQHGMVVCRIRIADALTSQGKLAPARAEYESALAIATGLAAADPRNTGWRHDRAIAYLKLGDIRRTEGDGPGSLAAYDASLAILVQLTLADRENMEWQHDRAMNHFKIGELQAALGNAAESLAALRSALSIREGLRTVDVANLMWRSEVSATHLRIGEVLMAAGNLPAALAAFRACDEEAARLVTADPGNAVWENDLSVSHERIGDVRMAAADLPGALSAFELALEIRRRLVAREPGNRVWQRGFAEIHSKVGDARTAQGRSVEARAAYDASLAIVERLAENSGDVRAQRDLVISCYKIATLGGDDQVRYLQRCHETLKAMRASRMSLDPPLLQLLARLDEGQLSGSSGTRPVPLAIRVLVGGVSGTLIAGLALVATTPLERLLAARLSTYTGASLIGIAIGGVLGVVLGVVLGGLSGGRSTRRMSIGFLAGGTLAAFLSLAGALGGALIGGWYGWLAGGALSGALVGLLSGMIAGR